MKSIEVAAGIIAHKTGSGEFLLCQRGQHKKYPLEWEFPGGKLEQGELPVAALVRELAEELRITVREEDCFHITTTEEHYPGAGTFRVHFYVVKNYEGEPHNTEFNAMEWVKPSNFGNYPILKGNTEVCRLMQEAEKRSQSNVF